MLAVLFATGLYLRLYDLTDLPLDFHPTRQLHSALIARGMYYQSLPQASADLREIALSQQRAEGIIEPPILERLAAWGYTLIGAEQFWLPRLLSALFWLSAVPALWMLARQLSGPAGAAAALAYFLVLPFAVFASRSFQPDPLMTALILWTAWAVSRWQKKASPAAALLAGLLGGLAILVKSVAVFFVAGVWLGAVVGGPGLRQAVRLRSLWVSALLTILPYAIYHVYGYFIAGFLREQFALRFFPALWIDPLFYLRWIRKLQTSTGLAWTVLAVLSIWILPKAQRGLLLGWLGGYLLYTFTFAYHTTTHDYYQLPLVPLVGLGLAAAAQAVFDALRARPGWRVALSAGALLIIVGVTAYDIRSQLKGVDYRPEAAAMAALGTELRGYSYVGLFPDYGYRLAYWGWTIPDNWFASGDFEYRALAGQEIDPRALFAEKTRGKDLFVIADLDGLAQQPVLQQILVENYPVWKQRSGLVIYDLRPR